MSACLKHVGLCVTALDQSVAFYRDLLELQLVFEGPFDGPLYERILGVPGARGRVALLRGELLEIELFEFEYPRIANSDPLRPVCSPGITHFCLEVAHLPQMYRRLVAAGVRFHCAPIDFDGQLATYGRDLDGNVFELVETLTPEHQS